MIINLSLSNKKINKIRNIKLLFLILFIVVPLKGSSQESHVSISFEGTHIKTRSNFWLNAMGLKFGYMYTLNSRLSLITELGTTSLFGKDKKDTNLTRLFYEAQKRKALDYRIFRVGGIFLPLIFQDKPRIFIQTGFSLRHANEITHTTDPAGYLNGKKDNTSDIILNTVYDTRWDTGIFLGLSYQLQFISFINCNLFTELDYYGKKHSFTTIGIRTFLKINRR